MEGFPIRKHCRSIVGGLAWAGLDPPAREMYLCTCRRRGSSERKGRSAVTPGRHGPPGRRTRTIRSCQSGIFRFCREVGFAKSGWHQGSRRKRGRGRRISGKRYCLPMTLSDSSGWNKRKPELTPSLPRKTTTDDARSQSVQSVSVSAGVSTEYMVHANAQPWIEPFCPLASSTGAFDPCHLTMAAHSPSLILSSITTIDTAPSRLARWQSFGWLVTVPPFFVSATGPTDRLHLTGSTRVPR